MRNLASCLIAGFFLAVVSPVPAVEAAAPAPASVTDETRAALAVREAALKRLEGLLPSITEETYRTYATGFYNTWQGQSKGLAEKFDQTLHEELVLKINVEIQRILAWLAPPAADAPARLDRAFLERHCADCHDGEVKKGGLNLMDLTWSPEDPENLRRWVRVHDRMEAGEMPPKNKPHPDPSELQAVLAGLAGSLTESERAIVAREGRSRQRRLNAYEYENALRDLFHAPWLQVKGGLPDDGVAHQYNKSGGALDISHVQMARFMSLADAAIRQALLVQGKQPPTTTRRFYARDQKYLIKEYRQVPFNTWPDRQNFPLIGTETDIEARMGRAPLTVGGSDPVKRELEAVGWLGIAFPKWDRTPIPVAGRYRLRFSGYTIWAGPNGYSGLFREDEKDRIRQATRWHLPDIDNISRGRTQEPVSIYAEGGGQNRRLGGFDLTPDPKVHKMEVWLGANDSVMPRATALYQPRPPAPTNPRAQRDGAPGVAFRWLEIEGPLYDESTTAGYRLLFGDLPLTRFENNGRDLSVTPREPREDAARLLRHFVSKAWLRPAAEADVADLLKLIHAQLDAGVEFAEAMIAGYTAALASPGFLILTEQPGALDDYAVAARLSFFLTNSPPDENLRRLAASGTLRNPDMLGEQTDRLLNDPKIDRFIEAFLDYWLDLRKIEATSPDLTLYNDYYLDDALVEAAVAESRLYFAEMLKHNLPARQVVASDFTFLNERLARHYGIPGVRGVAMRRVPLPPDSPRGGFLTQASVLKVTANGTTTSPVLRGKWITERILGHEIPPPPPVDAVEPDIRGAVTIRQQLDKHRSSPSCASCHVKMDPPGFALESFDVLGGWRDRYRAIDPVKPTEAGFGKDGAPFRFHYALPVDAAGELPDGRAFADIREFKRRLLETEADETVIARSLLKQLVIYATGSPVRFSDRPVVEEILRRTQPHQHRLRHLIHELIQSPLFLKK